MTEDKRSSESIAVRLGGALVALASVLSAIFTILFLLKPRLFMWPLVFPPGHPGHLLGELFLVSVIVGGVGGLALFSATKKPWALVPALTGLASCPTALLTLLEIGLGPGVH